MAGVDWEYIVCGQGGQALLLLPGAHGLGEVASYAFPIAARDLSPGAPFAPDIGVCATLLWVQLWHLCPLQQALPTRGFAVVQSLVGACHAGGISGPVARRVTLASAHQLAWEYCAGGAGRGFLLCAKAG